MTSLRKRLDFTLSKLSDIREKLQNCCEYPPCCLNFHKDGRVSCDVLGPLPEKTFLTQCEICRNTMTELLEKVCESAE